MILVAIRGQNQLLPLPAGPFLDVFRRPGLPPFSVVLAVRAARKNVVPPPQRSFNRGPERQETECLKKEITGNRVACLIRLKSSQ